MNVRCWVICHKDGDNAAGTYFYVSRSAVEIHVQIFDLAVFTELVCQVFLCGFLMYAGNKHNPSLNSYIIHRSGAPSVSVSRIWKTGLSAHSVQRVFRIPGQIRLGQKTVGTQHRFRFHLWIHMLHDTLY
jgi:hypothetical protein